MNPRIARALLWFEQSRFVEAEAELRAALAQGDASAEVHAMLGLCLLHSGLTDAAKAEVQLALQTDAGCAYAHYALSYVQQATLQFWRIPVLGETPADGSLARACVKSAARAVELAPHDERYFVRLAEVHQLFGEWRKSLGPAEHALSLSPDDVPAAICRAEALTRLGRAPEARATLARALELDPEASAAHAGMGWVLLRAGEHERATRFFDEALRLHADSSWAQEGALECAKHRYPIYRWLFLIKQWHASRHMILRILLALAGLAVLFGALVGVFELLDPLVRPHLGNKGTALLFTPLGFAPVMLLLYHEYLFLWLVRRQAASKSTTGEAQQGLARKQLGIIVVAVCGVIGFHGFKALSTNLAAIFLGLSPGGYLLWLTATQAPGGRMCLWWWIYSGAVLVLGPVVGVVFQDQIGRLGRPEFAVVLVLPVVPLAVAIEHYKKRELTRKHDQALTAQTRDGASDTKP